MTPIAINPAQPDELRQVLRISLSGRNQSAADLERHVTSFLEFARAMSIDLGLQWLCRRDGQTVSACTCVEYPGRTAILMLPSGGAAAEDVGAQRRLIEHVVAHESKRDIRLLQSLIDVDDELNRRALEDAGFHEIATLRYLELKLTNDLIKRRPEPPQAFRQTAMEWVEYGPESHRDLARLIEATNEGGLDCPGLSNLRDIEDVIEGHKAAGQFDPCRWLLLRCAGDSLGCILFAENPLRPASELVYMGVHPRARSRSLGRHILDYGLYMAYRERFQTVTLAVDSRNHPARRLYERAGFRLLYNRRAMIRPAGVSSNDT